MPIFALDSPGVPSCVTCSRTRKPWPRNPPGLHELWSYFAVAATAGDRVSHLPLLLWHEETVTYIHGLSWVSRKYLHNKNLFCRRVSHRMQEIIFVTPATIVHDSPIDVNDCFWSGDHIFSIDKVLTIFLFQGQVGSKPALVLSLELPNFDVSCPFWDFHYICVALTEWGGGKEKREKESTQ